MDVDLASDLDVDADLASDLDLDADLASDLDEPICGYHLANTDG